MRGHANLDQILYLVILAVFVIVLLRIAGLCV